MKILPDAQPLSAKVRYAELFESRKMRFRIAAAVCLPVLLLLLLSCSGRLMEQPVFTLKAVSLEPIGNKEIKITIGMEVRNPNLYELELKTLDFKFYLDDREIGKGGLTEEIRAPKDSISKIRIPITAKYIDFGDYLKAAISGRKIRYRLTGDAKIKAGLAKKTIPFDTEGTIDPADQLRSK